MRAERNSISKSSLALHNLRGFTILMVVAVHSAMAYVDFNPALQPRYDSPPLISDSHRWIGFDLLRIPVLCPAAFSC